MVVLVGGVRLSRLGRVGAGGVPIPRGTLIGKFTWVRDVPCTLSSCTVPEVVRGTPLEDITPRERHDLRFDWFRVGYWECIRDFFVSLMIVLRLVLLRLWAVTALLKCNVRDVSCRKGQRRQGPCRLFNPYLQHVACCAMQAI